MEKYPVELQECENKREKKCTKTKLYSKNKLILFVAKESAYSSSFNTHTQTSKVSRASDITPYDDSLQRVQKKTRNKVGTTQESMVDGTDKGGSIVILSKNSRKTTNRKQRTKSRNQHACNLLCC